MTAESQSPQQPQHDPNPSAVSPMRRFIFAVALLALLAGLCSPFFVDPVVRGGPRAQAGVIDFSRWGPLSAPVQLKGGWRMVWLSAPTPGAEQIVPVPSNWIDQKVGGKPLPTFGAASYRLRVEGLRPGHYTIYLRQGFHARRLYVNGQLLSERGIFGLTPETSAANHRADEVTFDAGGAPLDLRIDIANFHHRETGLDDAPIFGLADAMGRWSALDWIQTLILSSALLLLAAYGLVVSLFRPKERASLYFGIACVLLLPFAAQASHDDLITLAVPSMSLAGILAWEYISAAGAVVMALVYVRELYPRETPRWPYWGLQVLNITRTLAYVVFALAGNTYLMSVISQWASYLRTVDFVGMLIVVAAAGVRRREGSLVFLFGLGSFVVSLIYTDTVNNLGVPPVFGSSLLPMAILLLLFSQLLILAERWSTAIDASEQSNADLRRLLDVNISISSEMQLTALLKKIVKATTAVIHADRSSLFLHDERRGELASVVAEGVEGEPIHFPSDQGLAGWVFTRGEAVNLADAYADPRFNRDVDAATGYQTHSVITVPVTTRDGRRVGVMQALNHRGSKSFGDSELERMSAFAAQAAIAIENATLFAEVAAERNYNESILRSMSSGVITLDRELRVAKLNDAACRILRVSPEAAGANAELLLTGPNSWLLAEVEAVNRGSQAKSLLDADIATVGGEIIAANLSIVPLLADAEHVGLLILIEDITEGKRLQGAMRRFMTQNVVDQIMGREDELLFGSACRATVAFADIRGFTTLAENLEPRDTVDMLNEIFTELFEAVSATDGMLDKFMGDALMAVYGAPLSSGRDALNAVDGVVAMFRAVAAINARRRGRGAADIRLGIGVASGEVVAGTIGSPKRMDYTVIGDSVNLASRLEKITKVYGAGVVICEETAAAVKGVHPLRELDIIRVRGRRRPARIFQVLTDDRPVPDAALEAYARGRAALAAQDWPAAAKAFEAAVEWAPDDQASAVMLQRAQSLVRQPPPADWDGVWVSAEAAWSAGVGPLEAA